MNEFTLFPPARMCGAVRWGGENPGSGGHRLRHEVGLGIAFRADAIHAEDRSRVGDPDGLAVRKSTAAIARPESLGRLLVLGSELVELEGIVRGAATEPGPFDAD